MPQERPAPLTTTAIEFTVLETGTITVADWHDTPFAILTMYATTPAGATTNSMIIRPESLRTIAQALERAADTLGAPPIATGAPDPTTD